MPTLRFMEGSITGDRASAKFEMLVRLGHDEPSRTYRSIALQRHLTPFSIVQSGRANPSVGQVDHRGSISERVIDAHEGSVFHVRYMERAAGAVVYRMYQALLRVRDNAGLLRLSTPLPIVPRANFSTFIIEGRFDILLPDQWEAFGIVPLSADYSDNEDSFYEFVGLIDISVLERAVSPLRMPTAKVVTAGGGERVVRIAKRRRNINLKQRKR